MKKMSRRERMIAHAINVVSDHDIIIITDRFVGDYGRLAGFIYAEEARYVAGVIDKFNIFTDVEMTDAGFKHYQTKVTHINDVTVIVDNGRRVNKNSWLNPRGNVTMVEPNGMSFVFNKEISKFIISGNRYYETVADVFTAYKAR